MPPAFHIPSLPTTEPVREPAYEPASCTWELLAPCESCQACRDRRVAEFAITYMNAHFGRALERLDPLIPGYLRAVDKLVAERDREVAKITLGIPGCYRMVVIDRGAS